ncbi:MAG: ribulose-phosphate 3-epimerase [Verrucomicrobia bacterium]|nr:ribulose-phosphate 3-epimerase [Verrucomicrobiota bacterium]
MATSPHPVILAPSLLGGNHTAFGESLQLVSETRLEWVHLDIMDGHFVPNLSFGPQLVSDLRTQSDLFFDVHLMLDNPHAHLDAFIQAGADQITIHLEPDYPVKATLERIKAAGKRCGIALNPNTPAEAAEPFLALCDIVVVMTVEPGFGGQSFREDVLPKMETLSRWREEKAYAYRLQADGGVTTETAPACLSRGIDTLVAGTAFFKSADKEAFAQAIIAQ